MATREPGPGVPFPPMILFVVAFALGLALQDQRALPLVSGDLDRWRVVIGAGLTVAGSVFFWWGMATFARARTGIMLESPARELIIRGPYKWSRNPMYVGMVISYAGLSLLANSVWPLLFLPVAIALLVTLIISREERYLRAQFGAEYETYCKRVNRWV